MLRRRKNIVSQYFRLTEPKSAFRFCLSRLVIEICAFCSTYFHSNPGQLLNNITGAKITEAKMLNAITDANIAYNYSQLSFYLPR